MHFSSDTEPLFYTSMSIWVYKRYCIQILQWPFSFEWNKTWTAKYGLKVRETDRDRQRGTKRDRKRDRKTQNERESDCITNSISLLGKPSENDIQQPNNYKKVFECVGINLNIMNINKLANR